MWLIQWGWGLVGHWNSPRRLAQETGLEIDYCEPLADPLQWGPQHVDLRLLTNERLIRR